MSKRFFSLLAELFFTASALILLFLVYQVWFTTEVAKVQQEATAELFRAAIEQGPTQDQQEPVAHLIQGVEIDGVGLIYIPRLREQVWGTPIVSGTGSKSLSLGVGHYSKTSLPGELGNFAIAGHRATNGEPFAYFENLMEGDMVFVQTISGWFSYQLVEDKKIQENEVWVIGNDPIGLGETRLITLTTCDPRWNSTQRWAWWGVQTAYSEDMPVEVAQ